MPRPLVESIMSIRDKLLPLIRADGRRFTDLASEAGIPQSTLSSFVTGDRGRDPRLEFVARLARALGLNATALGELLYDAYPPRTLISAFERRTRIKEELSHIPDSPKGAQRQLRKHFGTIRRDSLASKPLIPGLTAAGALALAIRRVQKRHPDFEPAYDSEFFGELPEIAEGE